MAEEDRNSGAGAAVDAEEVVARQGDRPGPALPFTGSLDPGDQGPGAHAAPGRVPGPGRGVTFGGRCSTTICPGEPPSATTSHSAALDRRPASGAGRSPTPLFHSSEHPPRGCCRRSTPSRRNARRRKEISGVVVISRQPAERLGAQTAVLSPRGSRRHRVRWRQRIGPGVSVLRSAAADPAAGAPLADAAASQRHSRRISVRCSTEPCAFYGHSLGALMARRSPCVLSPPAAGRRRSCSSAPAPLRSLPSRLLDAAALPGSPTSIVGLLAASMPKLLCSEHPWLHTTSRPRSRRTCGSTHSLRSAPPARLPCPLWAFAGRDDRMVERREVRAAETLHHLRFHFRMMPGAHFFVRAVTTLAVKEAPAERKSLPHVAEILVT